MSAPRYLAKIPVHSLLARKGDQQSSRGWDIDSPTFRHRAVMSLFGPLEDGSREKAGILFRLERIPGQAPFFLVQSAVRPDNVDGVDGVEMKEWVFPELVAGRPVSFRLAANAVRRRTVVEAGKRRTVVSSVPFDHNDDAVESGEMTVSPWIRQKLAGALADVQVTNHLRDVLQDPSVNGRRKALQVDTIDGIGLVEDVEALRAMVEGGVGREKAYGCGLLSVRPLV
ncbi:type I-E CRISPR-associated protein Cas6/Cse3/CasE [Corynebacterium freneyi]|uniref:type I-E CRISPR-associated protein Cas6/Cse3/CasE n=1 Tax=Corynebacterium freneyi TaxID=134034 RepID=UPI001CC953D6|nr:type I-E CRISPR-associated protein Cas6/Cse3/CasE [Corynebacterium freneyi]UBI02231.1 type I-E CRISPR-associated protein Cas6/Cse3/CasE [Corynebacterium freneyi]